MLAISVHAMQKRFDGIQAVDELSFDVPVGEIFGMLGPNGAGKTTTIRILVDIFKPDSGEVSVLGMPPGKSQPLIGYMPEERGLYRNLKVIEAPVYLGQLKGMTRRDAEVRARQLLDRVDLSEWSGKRVKDLSRGMQQKLQFIATIIHRPKVVILDEPFQGLDPVNVEMIKGLIRDLRDEGATVLLSSHQMNLVEVLCHRILLMDHGRSVLQGTLAEIRERFSPNTVEVKILGALPALPMVAQTESRDGTYTMTLRPGASSSDLLKALANSGCAVERFELSAVPLEQIFLTMVKGEQHA
jgi:ABC-2 type transport system ATP-binding protein